MNFNPDLYYVRSKGTVWETYIFPTKVKGFEVQTRFISLLRDGTMIIREGYPWDFATKALDTESIIKASLIHDAFCELINNKFLPVTLQERADAEFRRIAKLEKMNVFRRWYTHRAIRIYQKNKKIGSTRKILKV